MATRPRLDSSLESEGAEFLVLGLLLCEGIQASKAYTKQPGYDLIAFEPELNRSCRIQVKSRWATDYDGSFLIKNSNCDFVAHVALNRGFRGYRKKATPEDDGRRPPVIYIFPIAVVERARGSAASWGKVFVQAIPEASDYIENWQLIRDFLNAT